MISMPKTIIAVFFVKNLLIKYETRSCFMNFIQLIPSQEQWISMQISDFSVLTTRKSVTSLV